MPGCQKKNDSYLQLIFLDLRINFGPKRRETQIINQCDCHNSAFSVDFWCRHAHMNSDAINFNFSFSLMAEKTTGVTLNFAKQSNLQFLKRDLEL